MIELKTNDKVKFDYAGKQRLLLKLQREHLKDYLMYRKSSSNDKRHLELINSGITAMTNNKKKEGERYFTRAFHLMKNMKVGQFNYLSFYLAVLNLLDKVEYYMKNDSKFIAKLEKLLENCYIPETAKGRIL